MRTGFAINVSSHRQAILHRFEPLTHRRSPSLISFAQEQTTGSAAVLMGTLFYHAELKQSLGLDFQRDLTTHAEIILQVYQAADWQGLIQLEGEFACVLWDRPRSQVLALRDPLGAWPLYWFSQQGQLWLGTNLRYLAQQQTLAHPSASPQINPDFLASFLTLPLSFVELPTTTTAFCHIQRVLPGNLLTLKPEGSHRTLWTWDGQSLWEPTANLTLSDAGQQFQALLRRSIQERMRGQRVAAHLSGGMDSSSIVCLAREAIAQGHPREPLLTLSLVYQLRNLVGETAFIKAVIQQGGPISAQLIEGDRHLDFQWFSGTLPDHDEPYGDLFHLGLEQQLMRVAQEQGATVILNGVGAELLSESNRYYLADLAYQGRWGNLWQETRRWAEVESTSFWAIFSRFALQPLLPAIAAAGIHPLFHRGYGQWPKLGPFAIPPWIDPAFAQNYHLWEKQRSQLRELYRYPFAHSFCQRDLQALAGNWSSWYLGAPLGIRVSQPFLDPRLIRFCVTLPRAIRDRPGQRKPLLQAAMQGILPESIRQRRVQPSFNEVYWQGLAQNLPALEQMVQQSSIQELGIFQVSMFIEAMQQQAIGLTQVASSNGINLGLGLIAWYDRMQRALKHSPEIPTATDTISAPNP